MGQFAPAFDTQIEVRLYHVLPNGRLVRQAGCQFAPGRNGNYGIMIEPPAGGWIPGPMRAVVALSDLKQVSDTADFEAVGEPVAVPWAGAAPSQASKLVVQLPLAEVKAFDLPPGVTYLVEGHLRPKVRPEGVTGPRVFCETILIREDATRVTADNAVGPSFVQHDGTCWYQIQLKSPPKPGLHHVKLKTLTPGAIEGEPFGTSEFPFSIRVTEEKPAPKP
jgi:hypothetical protein